jgi:hypothetical protein
MFVMLGVALLKIIQKALYRFASCREDGQADHDKEYPLENRKKKTRNAEHDKEPADDQKEDFLEPFHLFPLESFNNIQRLRKSSKFFLPFEHGQAIMLMNPGRKPGGFF